MLHRRVQISQINRNPFPQYSDWLWTSLELSWTDLSAWYWFEHSLYRLIRLNFNCLQEEVMSRWTQTHWHCKYSQPELTGWMSSWFSGLCVNWAYVFCTFVCFMHYVHCLLLNVTRLQYEFCYGWPQLVLIYWYKTLVIIYILYFFSKFDNFYLMEIHIHTIYGGSGLAPIITVHLI